MDKEYLFVYGTLRLNFGLALMQEIKSHLVYVGNGRVNGVLYDLGDYPGAVKEESGEIVGDVVVVQNQSVWAVLDDYEGEEFCRSKETVTVESGETLTAWIYWYTGGEDRLRISHNDYLTYLKTKKDRFV